MTTTAGPLGSDGNWGRWGADDERGTLNLIDSEAVLRAAHGCQTGKVYNLGLPIARGTAPVLEYRGAPQRLTLVSQTDTGMYEAYGAAEGLGANEDVLVIATHNGTHMDALSHVFTGNQLYNGFPSSTFASHTGAGRCGIEKSGGFAAGAVILDLAKHFGVPWLEPGHPVTGDELEACRIAQGSEFAVGDALLVHTGWLSYYASLPEGERTEGSPQPGLDHSAVEFVDSHHISAVGADNSAVEVIPFSEGVFLALHSELLVKRGVTFLEHLSLAALAEDNVHRVLLVVAPLLIAGATGSPINPIAIA
jgi:kynurenine formamidase